MARRTDGGTVLLDPVAEVGPVTEVDPDAPAPGATRTAGRTVAVLIGLNLVLQVGLVVVIINKHLGLVTAVRISLLTGVVFYAVTAVVVRALSQGLHIRPRLGDGTGLIGAAEGVVVGGGAAVLLSALLRLAFGRPMLDPTSGALAAGGAAWLALGVLVVAVLAPLVEEFVFRGFLLEAYRSRGQTSAVVFSAIAFSLAHLTLAGFRYYLVMGMAFAVVYWRRGLIGSVAAHAAFNGTLLIVAVTAMHAPARQVSTAGFTVSVPAAWSTSTGVSGDDLVASGPAGTKVELAHADGTRPLDVDALARDLGRRAVTTAGDVVIDPTTVTVVQTPVGRAATAAARVNGRDGRVVMIPKGTRLWIATVRRAPGDEAADQVDRILRSWRQP